MLTFHENCPKIIGSRSFLFSSHLFSINCLPYLTFLKPKKSSRYHFTLSVSNFLNNYFYSSLTSLDHFLSLKPEIRNISIPLSFFWTLNLTPFQHPFITLITSLSLIISSWFPTITCHYFLSLLLQFPFHVLSVWNMSCVICERKREQTMENRRNVINSFLSVLFQYMSLIPLALWEKKKKGSFPSSSFWLWAIFE